MSVQVLVYMFVILDSSNSYISVIFTRSTETITRLRHQLMWFVVNLLTGLERRVTVCEHGLHLF